MIAQTLGRWDPTRPWRSDSTVDKVRAYTRQSFLAMCLTIGAAGAVAATAVGDPWSAVCVGI
ncbi:MAG: sensor histidine kinase, partial [Rhodococcus sp. (in: high G+C Gram-positive bacteria)]